jgi:hypothetical protein
MTKRKANIKYERPYPPRRHEDSSFRGLRLDDENQATVSTVLGIDRERKVSTSDVLCLMARVHTGANALG